MINKLFDRWLPGATLATWSAVLLYFFLSGRVQAFLAPTFRPYVLIAGGVLAVMALAILFAPKDSACCASEDCAHPLGRLPVGKVLTFVVLLLPITVTAVVSPDSFGRGLMENRGIDTDGSTLGSRKGGAFVPPEMPLPTKEPAAPAAAAAPVAAAAPAAASDYLQRSADGNIVAEVLDLLYAAQDSTLRKDFEGRKIELTGQLMPDKTSAPAGAKRFKAVRMFMSCCAADARPVAALVEAASLPDLPEMTWVKVVGTSTFPIENGRRTSIIRAERVEKAEPPQETMLY